MEHLKFSIQSSYCRKFDSLQNCLSHAKSKNASFKRYGPKHYRSFSKVNKRTLFSKGHIKSMENYFDVRPKTLVRGLSKVSKKSTSLKKILRYEEMAWCTNSPIFQRVYKKEKA